MFSSIPFSGCVTPKRGLVVVELEEHNFNWAAPSLEQRCKCLSQILSLFTPFARCTPSAFVCLD